MPEVRDITTTAIDPDSSVNVRRSRIEESVETVKSSIAKFGFWGHSPITIRLHPDRESHFEYEVVAGQCRLRACMELDIEQIPAVVLDVDDDAAIQQSWAENEFSSEITTSDKAHWIHKIVLRASEEGKTMPHSRQIAAAFFNISEQTVITYLPLTGLPEDVKQLVDIGNFPIKDATKIAKNTYSRNIEESEEKMRERTFWFMDLNTEEKRAAHKAIGELPHNASIEELKTAAKNILDTEFLRIKVAVPADLRDRLMNWGEERGLINVNPSIIIQYMVSETLRRGE